VRSSNTGCTSQSNNDTKPLHLRPPDLRLDFEDEYAHLAWSADLGIAAP